MAGMTLVEILIVLAIVAVMVWLMPNQLGILRKGSVRNDAARLAAAMRWSYDRAAATAAHHRMVIDLDKDTFQVERCEGTIRMVRSMDEAHAEEQQAINSQYQMLPEMAAAIEKGQAPPGAGAGAYAPPGAAAAMALPGASQAADVGSSGAALKCQPVKGKQGKVQHLTKKISKVYVAHLTDAATAGTVVINFFPNGRAERAVVEVGEGDDVFSLRLWALTGRVQIHTGEYHRPDDVVKGEEVRE
jgi:prepilin-type N-terminal cleavage/methylation domain-containing protein